MGGASRDAICQKGVTSKLPGDLQCMRSIQPESRVVPCSGLPGSWLQRSSRTVARPWRRGHADSGEKLAHSRVRRTWMRGLLVSGIRRERWLRGAGLWFRERTRTTPPSTTQSAARAMDHPRPSGTAIASQIPVPSRTRSVKTANGRESHRAHPPGAVGAGVSGSSEKTVDPFWGRGPGTSWIVGRAPGPGAATRSTKRAGRSRERSPASPRPNAFLATKGGGKRIRNGSADERGVESPNRGLTLAELHDHGDLDLAG